MLQLGRLFGDVTHLHFIKLHQTISQVELGKGQPPILDYLTKHDGCIQSDIARRERKTAATTTVMLQTMEKNGLIERRSSPEDHRTVRVYITEKGREANVKAQKALQEMDDEVFSDFTPEERRELARLLTKMRDSLKKILKVEEDDR